ncbi:LysE family translocator [Tropicimonas sp. S265A]|uniref:LysE family translocator n=1 Tax=Tropicimonas sp. S265A TaxID=3415134 RepID=UPI003C7A5875
MSFDAWLVFVTFWALFVTTPGPNAVNCIGNGMTHGFARSLWGVAGILTQAALFLTLSAAGVTALITAAPDVFAAVKLLGALLLIALGVRAWLRASLPMDPKPVAAHGIYGRAFLIATINAKSLAGYLAAFSQFVQPDVPIWEQMRVIFPSALTLTALSYVTYTALGAWLGKLALGAVLNVWVRRALAVCFVVYGVALALYAPG